MLDVEDRENKSSERVETLLDEWNKEEGGYGNSGKQKLIEVVGRGQEQKRSSTVICIVPRPVAA